MRYVAAYMLAVLGGNSNPSQDDMKKILSSVGVNVEDELLTKVFNEFQGKNVDELCQCHAIRQDFSLLTVKRAHYWLCF
eukprot:m.75919 g.75919  ORF g.75919 m.75919 type:complete len:79 (-) comp12463_c0_seq2:306-542(-)